jgi:glucose/arabinose dehydrogenase
MKIKIFYLLGWFFSILISILWTYENPEKIEHIKDKLNLYEPKNNFVDKTISNSNKEIFETNHFKLELEKIIEIEGKTSFLLNNSINKEFNINDVTVFTQEGFAIKKDEVKKLKINKNFTDDYNGGLKTVFFVNNKIYGLTSSKQKDCYYAAIVNLSNRNELFKSNCISHPDSELIDFNGLGSSNIHLKNQILISIGTPTTSSNKIRNLAQNKSSFFGKILSLNKNNFMDKELTPKIYSLGHRNPQGITKIKSAIFSVEHGPKGGDELNRIIENKNYGWPNVSYGTKYSYDEIGKSYLIGHENNGFEEPIFAFVPSIGISSVNRCPSKLRDYYKKNCLIGLSLYGNNLRVGKSIILFLLDENLEKIHSIEKIQLGGNYVLRHFMTNKKNEIFEDADGDIYISSDNVGVLRISFNNFR